MIDEKHRHLVSPTYFHYKGGLLSLPSLSFIVLCPSGVCELTFPWEFIVPYPHVG